MGEMFLYEFDGKEFDGVYVGYTHNNNAIFFTDEVMT
jgi:hypothetical protein